MPSTHRATRAVETMRVRAMGTDAHIVVVGGPLGLALDAAAHLAALERRWSRFLPDSDIGRANARAGTVVAVHDDTILLVQRALDAWRRTDGRFDPTVHDALVALGYDRPFAAMSTTGTLDTAATSRASVGRTRPAPGCIGIEVDADAGTVRFPPGVRCDFGGIGKGLAADLVVERLREQGAAGALVSIGGDLRASGRAPGGASWTFEVEDPFDLAATHGLLAFAGGVDVALATSSVLGRRWRRDGHAVHHLVDPATGAPLASSIVAVTVVAFAAAHAEVATKAVIDGGRWPGALGPEPPALVFHADGRVERRGGIEAYLHPAPEADAAEAERRPACSAR